VRKKSVNLKEHSIYLYLICFIYLYSLFALDRIKSILSFKVDGIPTTNEIWLVLLIVLVIIDKKKIYRYDLYLGICLLMYMIDVFIGGFNTDSISQYFLAILLFVIPILLYFSFSNLSSSDVILFFKIAVLVCLIYATFAIILVRKYAFFIQLIGLEGGQYIYYSQSRPRMMLGSSITVSYYFNLTLPLCFYMFYYSKEKVWRVIAFFSIATNVLATFLLLSRMASLCMIIITLYGILYSIIFRNNSYRKNIVLFMLFIVVSVYAFQNYDLSRLISTELYKSGVSIQERLRASNLGLYIFSKQPILGSGMGSFFKRAYIDRYITVDGISALIDPHNMYILILSETGLIGFIILFLFFLILFKRISYIKERSLRHTAYLIFFAFLLDAIGGSHLFNEISYSNIFWIYMGLFRVISVKDKTCKTNECE